MNINEPFMNINDAGTVGSLTFICVCTLVNKPLSVLNKHKEATQKPN